LIPATPHRHPFPTRRSSDLLETDRLPRIVLADAVMTFRNLSHQPDGPWLVPLADGRCANAVELLFKFFEAGRSEFLGRDLETDRSEEHTSELQSRFDLVRRL